MSGRQHQKISEESTSGSRMSRPPAADRGDYTSPRDLGDPPTSLIDKPMLFYLVDWVPPDFGAVGQYGLIFAAQIARSGRRVCLIGLTSGAYNTTREVLAHGAVLEIKRLGARRYNKSGLLSRLIW